ncbi:guanylate kinase [Legionella israelensis]|uniref:Guanylate kinase n=1 Tax=Legionella israelensis TaxID=454 RepID=A0A0W0VYF9_9GAMM|nr:guanylate kinase [Legionella israelensis]KTD25037.1 guanylate kinase [Legionella israelensis]QBS10605.1 guanylate kinase [Legionella israelensis]SCY19196.1 guanylate kinase [Legionella israelensis DSM 19235]STX57553.1 guanylate kinase [Legionella israelensis]
MADQISGNVFILAAPSGGGKTSLIKKLVKTLDNIEVSISHTTRPQRPGEKNGVDYYFIDEEQFLKMINENAFVEHAKVFDYFYGTSVDEINNRLKAGIDVILDIDWQGAQQIKHLFPSTASIFILPPSLSALRQRLSDRQREDVAIIQDRMKQAQKEISHYGEFDYLIVNEDFEKAAFELQAIVIAHRLRLKRQALEQAKLLSFLLSSK